MQTGQDPLDPSNLIEACSQAILSAEPRSTAPAVLYHLTDMDALMAIFQKRRLWASLATTLNDSLEVRYGIGVAEEILETRLRQSVTDYDSALLAYLLDPSAAPKQAQFEMAPLVVSFCASVEKSGQWLHYGRSGRGFAIGFASEIATAVNYDLVKVDYDRDSQRRRMALLMDSAAPALAAIPSTASATQRDQLILRTAHVVSLYVPHLAARMKHPSFSEEDEWRLIAHWLAHAGTKLEPPGTNRPLEFRKSGERLVPYEELDFSNETAPLIKEVVIGHAAPVSVDVIRVLALERGVDASIRRSEVPVR